MWDHVMYTSFSNRSKCIKSCLLYSLYFLWTITTQTFSGCYVWTEATEHLLLGLRLLIVLAATPGAKLRHLLVHQHPSTLRNPYHGTLKSLPDVHGRSLSFIQAVTKNRAKNTCSHILSQHLALLRMSNDSIWNQLRNAFVFKNNDEHSLANMQASFILLLVTGHSLWPS